MHGAHTDGLFTVKSEQSRHAAFSKDAICLKSKHDIVQEGRNEDGDDYNVMNQWDATLSLGKTPI